MKINVFICRSLLSFGLGCFIILNAFGQTVEKFVYTLPATEKIAVQSDIQYSRSQNTQLKFNLYRLSKTEKPLPLPVVVLPRPGEKESFYVQEWSKLFAASGFAAISYLGLRENQTKSFDELMAYLRANKTALGIDPENVVIHTSSGLVNIGLPLAMDQQRTYLKAAVIYFGITEVKEIRPDLPLLIVRAGLDSANTNKKIDNLIIRLLSANTPVEIINYPGGHHPFEVSDDNDFSRNVIARTLEFMQRAVAPGMRQAILSNLDEAKAAGAVTSGEWKTAIALYEDLVQRKPNDSEMVRLLADAYYGNQNYSRALQFYEQALTMGSVRVFHISYPAAIASLKLNNKEGAYRWLERLVKTGFPRSNLTTDPNFEPLKNEPRFLALIEKPEK